MIIKCLYLDADISAVFNKSEIELTDKISNILVESGFSSQNIREKVHVIIGIVDNYCHEVVYHKHDSIDYDVMKKVIINTIKGLLS